MNTPNNNDFKNFMSKNLWMNNVKNLKLPKWN